MLTESDDVILIPAMQPEATHRFSNLSMASFEEYRNCVFTPVNQKDKIAAILLNFLMGIHPVGDVFKAEFPFSRNEAEKELYLRHQN